MGNKQRRRRDIGGRYKIHYCSVKFRGTYFRFCLLGKRMDPFPTLNKLEFKKNRVVGKEVEDDMYQCTAHSTGSLGDTTRWGVS